jgi:methylmalonyl-CoA decarboxylase
VTAPPVDDPNVTAFIARWQAADGTELGNCQLFVVELADTRDNAYVFERRVTLARGDGSSTEEEHIDPGAPSPDRNRRRLPMSFIRTETTDQIGVITLDHPAKRNALSKALIDEVIAALDDFKSRRLRAAILRARPGIKVWSAGHDVDELPASRRDPLGWDDPLRHLIRQIETFPAPVIAMVDGTVWGGACETVVACDLVTATPDATFAITPARLGVPYNIAGVLTFLNAATLRIAKEMAFTAQPISAERAERLGMINYVVRKDELEPFTFRLAATICENAPLSIAVMKEQLRILAGAHPMSPQGFERVQGLRRVVYDSYDYQEGIRAFKEKRKPVFRGE